VSSNLTQNSKFLPKVSGQYLENSRFAEMGSGDWFDLRLGGRLGSPGNEKLYAEKSDRNKK
jgi:hypothetical protein